MTKKLDLQWPHATYLREFPLGQPTNKQRRNVPFKRVEGAYRILRDWDFSPFAWRLAKTYEQGPNHDTVTGCWGANYRRMSRLYGDPGSSHFGPEDNLDGVPEETYQIASAIRPALYYRNANLTEVRDSVRRGEDIRVGMEVGCEWYDPQEGRIEYAPENWLPLGSHSVPLSDYVACDDRYHFENSWGYQWGGKGPREESRPVGCGSVPGVLIKERAVEAWTAMSPGIDVPSNPELGLRELHWKWSPRADFGIHVREIRDGDNRCAWAFCITRDGYLTVDEFFVAPNYRSRGFAQLLSNSVKELSRLVRKPIRLLLSFAESEPGGVAMRDAVARMFGVEWRPSENRFSYMVGDSIKVNGCQQAWHRIPEKPATILERLRPANESPISDKRIFEVHYGTDRQQRSRPHGVMFADTRGRRLSVGTASVCVPRTHRFGSVGRWHLLRWAKGADDRLRILSAIPKTPEQFALDAGAMRLETGERCRHLLFIHGYNVSFNEACIRCAQLGFDLKVSGHTFLYSWPSAGRLLRYGHDEATVEAAFPHFCEFMKRVAGQLDGEGLSIIAHSMGNRLLVRWLENQSVVRPSIESLTFTAADVDCDTFANGLKQLADITKQVSIYTAAGDIPLFMSKLVHGYNRAGISPPVIRVEGAETIAVKGLNLFELGHDYFGSASAILHDQYESFHYGISARFRQRLAPMRRPDGSDFWSLDIS